MSLLSSTTATIADKLQYLGDIKSAIRSAITNKGVSVSTTTPFMEYASKIDTIVTGDDTNYRVAVEGSTSVHSVIDTTILSIRKYAFYSNQNIQTADFANCITIGDSAFYSCTTLANRFALVLFLIVILVVIYIFLSALV